MGTIGCKEFRNQLEPWLEGERHPDARGHLRDCPNCRSLVGDLQAIYTATREWAAIEPEPPVRVWTGLRAQLEKEGLIRDGRRVRPRWFEGIFSTWPRIALAGAYLAVVIAVAFGLSGPIKKRMNDSQWLAGAQITIRPLNAQFDPVEQKTISPLHDSNPVVTASLHKNLAIVDNYIALCEKSVREEPQNEMARDYLYEAYQQKADLLSQMSEREELGR
jgi:hypothetical protein